MLTFSFLTYFLINLILLVADGLEEKIFKFFTVIIPKYIETQLQA